MPMPRGARKAADYAPASQEDVDLAAATDTLECQECVAARLQIADLQATIKRLEAGLQNETVEDMIDRKFRELLSTYMPPVELAKALDSAVKWKYAKREQAAGFGAALMARPQGGL